MPREMPYGAWTSPVTSELIAAGTIRLSAPRVAGGDVYWHELRPIEGGRVVVVRRAPDGRTADLISVPFNARTRVHEYGGGDSLVDGDTLYFANFSDQRLYRVRPGAEPEPLTSSEGMRYADAVVDRARDRLICVREDHSAGDREPVNTIVAIDLASGSETVLVEGSDFYASPRLSPDGRLCWLEWSHPNMPWDGCELRVGSIGADGFLHGSRTVAGGEDESVNQPVWSPSGELYFVSDRSSWPNLYRWDGGVIRPIAPRSAEFGSLQWTFGKSTYAFVSPDKIVCSYVDLAVSRLATINVDTGEFTDVPLPYTQIDAVTAGDGRVVIVGASPTRSTELATLDLATGALEVLRSSSNLTLDEGYISTPETIEFPTEGGLTAYGFFYRPTNQDFSAPTGELPPLLVQTHGGPTANVGSGLTIETQYWTSRGFAVLDVNYGGSTGYGRAYRKRLDGRWGVVDVDDCVNGALYLSRRGDVDPNRLAIRGGSAGGYTTLAALAFRDVFKVGASYFGVSDLEALARDTHKFESHYLDRLVGPYPDRRDLYVARSPIHHVDRLDCPVIFLQGLEDRVVPPSQAEAMVDALRRKGVPVAYVPFEGEQHGFRRSQNIERALDAELYFYGRVVGFTPSDDIEPVDIDNL